ncbi:MAG: chorismate synthase [Bacteroidia bacterium]
MAGNSFGEIFRVHTFGESHGEALGGIIDGCLPGMELDFEAINFQLQRRRPGQSTISTPRSEGDEVEFLSGLLDGKTTGTPIAFLIRNKNTKSADYDSLKDVFRPSHADFTYQSKYGIRDHRGGGRSSARETVSRVVAGSIAEQILEKQGISITAFVSQVGPVHMPFISDRPHRADVDKNIVRCPNASAAAEMIAYIEKMKDENDSAGGVITVIADGIPVGLGEPVFDKLHADLGKAMLSINAVKGFEIGSGFSAVTMKGSEHNDSFYKDADGKVQTKSNHSGGVQGGISNGANIYFRIAFKPVASIFQDQETIGRTGESTIIKIEGRHDPCVVPRAVPIAEAMTALVLVDHLLRANAIKTIITG